MSVIAIERAFTYLVLAEFDATVEWWTLQKASINAVQK